MNHMRPKLRLALCTLVIAVSVAYGILVATNSGVASAVALGYVSVLLTVLVVIDFGKRNHDRRLR